MTFLDIMWVKKAIQKSVDSVILNNAKIFMN